MADSTRRSRELGLDLVCVLTPLAQGRPDRIRRFSLNRWPQGGCIQHPTRRPSLAAVRTTTTSRTVTEVGSRTPPIHVDPVAAVQDVRAPLTEQGVPSVAANYVVGVIPSTELVAAVTPRQDIVADASGHEVDPRRTRLPSTARTCLVIGGAAFPIDDIVSRPAEDAVAIGVPGDRVVSTTTEDGVVPRPPAEVIIAGSPIDRVSVLHAGYMIVSPVPRR